MSINHIKNIWQILVNEGISSAWHYDLHETKRRHRLEYDSDGRYINGLDPALKYIAESNRPDRYKQVAVELVREITHNNELYFPFPKNSGLKDLVDATLSGRLQRKKNNWYIITRNRLTDSHSSPLEKTN